MKINTLIQSELAETKRYQAEWQAAVKRAISHNWPDKDKIMREIREFAGAMPEQMVRKCVGLGLDWVNYGEPTNGKP